MTKNVREALGIAFSASSLTWDKAGDEANIDRIVASAWTGEQLGRLLGRIKYGGDTTPHSRRLAFWMLVAKAEKTGRYGKQRATPQLEAMCRVALEEWLDDRCQAEGCVAGWLRLETKPRTCARCNGIGRVALTDEERYRRLHGEYDLRGYERILRRLQEADQRHNNETRKGLTDVHDAT